MSIRDQEDTRHGTLPLSRRRLLQAAAVGIAAGATAAVPGLQAHAAVPAPRRGGRLRVGMVGGGSSEQLTPINGTGGEITIARWHCLYERLVDFKPDGSLTNQLASEFSHNADGTLWKIKILPGVKFHDGSVLTAHDVVYSMRYVLNPKNNAAARSQISFINPAGIRALDNSTVEIRLDQPYAIMPTAVSSRALWIFKEGTTNFTVPNGTGPFKYKSFTPGERSVFVRHPEYHIPGRPYLDEVEIISISDPTTRVNALNAGQIDALGYLDPKLVAVIAANPSLRLLQHDGGGYSCQFMQVDKPPFTDNRVRQALRYMIDRPAILQRALLGYGLLGNDLPCPFDPDYAREIPQRPYDPEKARHLLKQAGKEGLTVSLYTGDAAPGMLDSSIIMAEQAKKVGVTLTIDKVPADQYWSVRYLKTPFETTNWGQRPFVSQIAQAYNINSPENETNWKRPSFDALTARAIRTLDPAKRHALWVEAQRILWNEGGYIIWGFLRYIDATTSRVHGITPSSVRPLGWYTFTDAYLA